MSVTPYSKRTKMKKETVEQYTEIAKRIISQIALLKKEYPHFSQVEPIKEKVHVSSDPFEIRFLYSHHMGLVDNSKWKPGIKVPRKILVPISKDGIYIWIRFMEKGKYRGQQVVFPINIGDMQVIVDILGGNTEIRRKILRIIVSEEKVKK